MCADKAVTAVPSAQALITVQRDLALVLSHEPEFEEALRHCYEAAIRVSGMDWGGIYLCDSDTGRLHLAYHDGMSPGFVKRTKECGPDTPYGQIVVTSTPAYGEYRDLMAAGDAADLDEGVRVLALLPVLHEDGAIGCLCVGSRTFDQIPPLTREALETIAVQVGGIIAHVRSRVSLRDGEARYRNTIDAFAEAVHVVDADLRIVLANRTMACWMTRLGLPHEVVGRHLTEAFPFLDPAIVEEYRQVFACGANLRTQDTNEIGGETVFTETQKIPIHHGTRVHQVITVMRDVTQERRAADELRRAHDELEQRVAERTEDLIRVNEQLRCEIAERTRADRQLKDMAAFKSVQASIRAVPLDADEEVVWEALLEGLVEHYGYCMAWYGQYSEGVVRPVYNAGRADTHLEGLELKIERSDAPDAQCAMSRAILDGAPFGYADLAHDEGFRAWRDYALALGYGSNLCVPLRVGDVVEGGVMVYAAQAQAFHSERIEQMELLTDEIGRMLTQRRQRVAAEKALSHSESRYRTLVESAGEAIFSVGRDGTFLFMNGTAARQMGGAPADFVGQTMYDLFPEEVAARQMRGIQGAIASGRGYVTERPTEIAGEIRWYRTSVQPIADAAESEPYALLVARDISERKQTEQSLELFRDLLDHSNDCVFLMAGDGRLVDVNETACTRLGYGRPGLLGLQLGDVEVPAADGVSMSDSLDELDDDGESMVMSQLRCENGTRVPVEFSAKRVALGGETYIVAVARDVTERKRLEEQLIRSERMAAVGTLAGGVAHEFNNINVSILGFSQLALERGDLDLELRNWLERIRNASLRARSITQNLLAYARPRSVPAARGNLVHLVRDTVDLMRRQLEKSGIEIDLNLSPVPDILLDPAQIGQVILNLLINAQHAMLGRTEKRLSVVTGADAGRLFVRVSDTGAGIPRRNLTKIFTPFFSTKGEYAGDTPQASVKGTGLGLSVSHTIIENHGGEIVVSSTVREGTAFTVWLPCREPPADVVGTGRQSRLRDQVEGRVLVLDDEKDTRDLILFVLGRAGYEVRVTGDAEEALLLLETEPYDVVLVDLQMPVMTGEEFLQRFDDLGVAAPPECVIITGRSSQYVLQTKRAFNVFGTLHKPFDIQDVEQIIVAALDHRHARQADREGARHEKT